MHFKGEVPYFLAPETKTRFSLSSHVSGADHTIHYQNVSVTHAGPSQAKTLLFHLGARSSIILLIGLVTAIIQEIIPFERKLKKKIYSFPKATVWRYMKLQVYTGKSMRFCDTTDCVSYQKKRESCSVGEFFPHRFS